VFGSFHGVVFFEIGLVGDELMDRHCQPIDTPVHWPSLPAKLRGADLSVDHCETS